MTPVNVSQFSSRRMNLKHLLTGFIAENGAESNADLSDVMVSDLKLDSRDVQSGDLFFGLKGAKHDTLAYIKSASQRGAVAAVTDARIEDKDFVSGLGIPVIELPELRNRLGEIASRFFGDPSRHVVVVGITGTNGKTSCSQFVAQSLSQLQVNCGVIGTLGYGAIDDLVDFGHTTPDAISLQRILSRLLVQKFEVVAMEVSSHGLDQGRASGVRFNTAIFTNLSRDHLDYHGDMEAYGQSKEKLFRVPGLKNAIINIDDSFGRQLADRIDAPVRVYRYSLEDQSADISVSKIQLSEQGARALVRSPWGNGIISSPLLGRFNLSNLLAVFTFLCTRGFSVDRAIAAVAGLDNVPGRMQRYGGGAMPLIVVDYAHTPDALQQALTTLREVCEGKLWCVFGCGGNRDKGKREIMGRMAEQFADQVVLTNDNPRREIPEDIIRDIRAGMKAPGKARTELNRAKAIQWAITHAMKNDVVLIAGKGHEGYQEIGGARMAFNDGEQVKQALNITRSNSSGPDHNNGGDRVT